jgi:hypothetical protein
VTNSNYKLQGGIKYDHKNIAQPFPGIHNCREPSLKGKPSTIVLLIKTGCFGKKEIYISNMKSS